MKISKCLVAAALALTAGPALSQPDLTSIVEAVDKLRLTGSQHLVVSIQLRTMSGQRVEPAYLYLLRVRRGVGALVEARDGDQRGQKYLSTPAGFWFYAPRTRQAIRMSPLQLVRGQASIGDISRMRYSGDYTARLQTNASQTMDGVPVWALQLKAKSQQATYATVSLYTAKADSRPIRADFMSAAGRRLKSVRFGSPVTISGHRLIQDTTFIDGIDPTKSTLLRITKVEEAATSPLMFKPQALGAAR